jgi:NitT/TauT family transport system substrate-binding protein
MDTLRKADFLRLCLASCVSAYGLRMPCASAQDLPTVRITGPAIDGFKTTYYALRAGLFRKHGLNVEIVQMGTGAAGLAAVAGGSVQVAFTSLPALILAHLHGLPFQIVAPGQLYLTDVPAEVLLVKKDSPIRTARDLNGKTIAGAYLSDLGTTATLAWVDQNGGDSKSMKVLEVPVQIALEALDAGRVDAFPVAAPYYDQDLATGQVRILAKPFDAIAKRFQAAAYVANKDYVSGNADTMDRFARAVHESILYTNAHLPETAALVASYSGVDAAIVARSVRAVDPEYVEARNLQPYIDFAAKYKLIPNGYGAQDLIAPTALKPPKR